MTLDLPLQPSAVESRSPGDEAGRDWWVITGMAVAATSAAVASFSGLQGLASLAGWPPALGWLLPITVDACAATSARVWLAATTRAPAARRFARANALGAITASITGNAIYHAVHAGLLSVTWPIIVVVGAVPAAVLGLTAHLHALRGRSGTQTPDPQPVSVPNPVQDRQAVEAGTGDRPESGPASVSVPDRDGTDGARTVRPQPPDRTATRKRSGTGGKRRPRYRTGDDLMAAARDADSRHREQYGRPITRDALRAALRISGPRATELRRALADDTTSAPVPDPTTDHGRTRPAVPNPAPAPVPSTFPDRKENATLR